MLMPAAARVSNMVADTPGWLRMPAPTSDTLAMSASASTSPAPISGARARVTSRLVSRSTFGTVKEMSVVPCSDMFCTMVSTLTMRSARARNSRAAMPGLVGDAGDGHLRLRGVVGDGGDDGLFHGRILLDDPGAGLPGEAGTDVQRHVVVAGELHRAQGQDPPAAGGDVEHLLEADPGQAAGLGHDARVGAEDAGHVGVDLAGVRAERGGQGDGGGVGAAPPERGDVALGGHPLEAGDHRDPVLGQRGAEAVALDLDDPGPGVRGVGDDPGLAPGERHGVDPLARPAPCTAGPSTSAPRR